MEEHQRGDSLVYRLRKLFWRTSRVSRATALSTGAHTDVTVTAATSVRRAILPLMEGARMLELSLQRPPTWPRVAFQRIREVF